MPPVIYVISLLEVVSVVILVLLEYHVYQIRIFYTLRDEVSCSGCGVLTCICFLVSGRTDRHRNPDLFKACICILVSVYDPCLAEPACYFAVNVAVLVVVPVFLVPRSCYVIYIVHVVDEIKCLADFLAGQVLCLVGSNCSTIAHVEVLEQPVISGTEAVYVCYAVAVGILGQLHQVLSPLLPCPLASLIECVRILKTCVVQHLLVEGQYVGRTGDGLTAYRQHEISSVKTVDVDGGQIILICQDIRICRKHLGKVRCISVSNCRDTECRLGQIDIAVRLTCQNGGIDGLLDSVVGQVHVLDAYVVLLLNALQVIEHHLCQLLIGY